MSIKLGASAPSPAVAALQASVDTIRFLDLGSAFREWSHLSYLRPTIELCQMDPFFQLQHQKTATSGYRSVTSAAVACGSAQRHNAKFFETRKTECSSLRKPNHEFIAQFYDADRFDIVQEHRVDVETVGGAYPVAVFDLIKIDVQGSAAEVLAGAPGQIAEAAAVIVEAEFVQLYRGQKLFDTVFRQMRHLGFDLVRFRPKHWLLQQDAALERSTQGALIFTDTLWLKRPSLLARRHATRRSAAGLLAAAYGCLDYACAYVPSLTASLAQDAPYAAPEKMLVAPHWGGGSEPDIPIP